MDMTSLFTRLLDDSKVKPGVVEITLPEEGSIRGCISDNVTLRMGNVWQDALPNFNRITHATGMINGNEDTATFLTGLQSIWIGAEPLTLTLPFYLFSLNSSSDVRGDLSKLQRLTSVEKKSNFSGVVHGGYKPLLVEGSGGVFTQIDSKVGRSEGFIKIKIGSQLTLRKMLLVSIAPEFSSIEVQNGNPLFIKVTATFKSYRPLYQDELKSIFT
jgi:hypothetical protein